MPNTHYVTTWANGANVDKANVRSGYKTFTPIYATPTEIAAMTTDQHALFISRGALYYYDSTDTTSAHDGINVIVSTDGYRYKPLQRTGPSDISVSDASTALKVTQAGAGNVVEFGDASSDTTPTIIDPAGKIVIGHTAAIGLTAIGITPNVQQVGSSSGVGQVTYSLLNYSTTTVPSFLICRAKNNTIGSHTVMASGDNLGQVRFAGSDGSDFYLAAMMQASVDAAPSSTIMPGRLTLQTASSAGTMTQALRIDSNQNVALGTGAPTSGVRLDVDGVIKVKSYTVATLPAAATVGAGAIAYVTDATAPTYNANVAGGGAVKIRVTSDGTNWKT